MSHTSQLINSTSPNHLAEPDLPTAVMTYHEIYLASDWLAASPENLWQIRTTSRKSSKDGGEPPVPPPPLHLVEWAIALDGMYESIFKTKMIQDNSYSHRCVSNIIGRKKLIHAM